MCQVWIKVITYCIICHTWEYSRPIYRKYMHLCSYHSWMQHLPYSDDTSKLQGLHYCHPLFFMYFHNNQEWIIIKIEKVEIINKPGYLWVNVSHILGHFHLLHVHLHIGVQRMLYQWWSLRGNYFYSMNLFVVRSMNYFTLC